MKIDIVILNYNTKKLLETLLPVVVRNSQIPQVSIVVADNASTDGSAEMVAAQFPDIELIKIPSNLGYAGGYNFALKNRTADYFLLLNSDAEPAENWLLPLIETAENSNSFGAAQPKILDFYKRDHFEYAGASGGFIDIYGFPFCRGRIFGNVEADKGQYDGMTEVFWATGAAFFISRRAWELAGGLDDTYFAHMEEIDLCWRLQLLGFKIYAVPESAVYHMGGSTLSNANPRKTFFNFRNSLLMLYKNLHLQESNGLILRRKLFDGLAGVFFLLQGKPSHTLQILKAHRAFNKLKPGIKRSSNAKKITELNHVLRSSLVLNFFIKSKKVFSSLRIN